MSSRGGRIALRLLVCVVLANAVLMSGAGPSWSAPGSVNRLQGENRYATAAAISQASFPGTSGTVLIATGDDFPDALAGAPAAAGMSAGPVLLTGRDALPAETAAELDRLQPSDIVVLGGPSAVSERVLDDLRGRASVQRVAGADRYATAAALSQLGFPSGADVAVLASGGAFADALAGGPAAIGLRAPLLLLEPSSVPSATRDELQRLGADRWIVLGGPAAVDERAYADLVALAEARGAGVERVQGASRYDTAVKVSQLTQPGASDRVFVATGGTFPDALAGGLPAGLASAPLLLTARDCLPPEVAGEIDRLAAQRMIILGGTQAVSEGVAAFNVCQPPPPPPPPVAEHCVDDPPGDVTDPRGDILRACLTYGDSVRATLLTAQPVDPFTDIGWVDGYSDFNVYIDPEGGATGTEDVGLLYGHGLVDQEGLAAIVFEPDGDVPCIGTASFDGSRYVIDGIPRACIGSPERFLFGVEFAYDPNGSNDDVGRTLDKLGSYPPSIGHPPGQPAPPPANPCPSVPSQRVSPEQASTCLYAAHKGGDRGLAEVYASQAAVEGVFEYPWEPPEWDYYGCSQALAESTTGLACYYYIPSQEVHGVEVEFGIGEDGSGSYVEYVQYYG